MQVGVTGASNHTILQSTLLAESGNFQVCLAEALLTESSHSQVCLGVSAKCPVMDEILV